MVLWTSPQGYPPLGYDRSWLVGLRLVPVCNGNEYPYVWYVSVVPVMSLHSIQHPFTPFYDALYICALRVYVAIRPSLQIRSTLAPSNDASRFHHYSRDTAGNSHMIVCEFHRLLLPWTNLGTVVTPHNRFPSPCRVQCISVATSLSYLLLYSPISRT